MNKFLNIVIGCFLLFCLSCINLKVSEAHKKLNPYVVGDHLIFKRSDAMNDTLIIFSVQEIKYPRGNMGGGFITSNSIAVYGVWKSQDNREINEVEPFIPTPSNLLLSLHPKKSWAENTLLIDFNFHDFSGNSSINLDSLAETRTFPFDTKYFNCGDVVLIKNPPSQLDTSFNPIDGIYWSKSKGLVRVVNFQGDSMDLIEKYNERAAIRK